MALLDCRDTRVSLWRPDGGAHSPGFVLFADNAYRFGNDAMAQSRLRPRDSSSRYWWQLSTQALKPSLGPARHTADLVHAHLRELHKEAGAPDTLALAVSDSMPREQLSLLLGVAQACEFTVSGLVSRSVLLASTSPVSRESRVLHLEVQLNQSIINELTVADGHLQLARSTPLPACGLLALQERCVSAIAAAFIQQTRFDPRRAAQSEQLLYNQLPTILSTLAERGEMSVDVDGHRARITASALSAASDKLLAGLGQVRDQPDLPLLLDPELLNMPGISNLNGQTHLLEDNALWASWQKQHSAVEVEGEDVHLIDRLPLTATETVVTQSAAVAAPAAVKATSASATDRAKEPSRTRQEPNTATHVLLGVKALALRGGEVDLGNGYVLRKESGFWALHGDGGLINGIPSTPHQPLHLGDTLSLGSAGHGRLIEVLD